MCAQRGGVGYSLGLHTRQDAFSKWVSRSRKESQPTGIAPKTLIIMGSLCFMISFPRWDGIAGSLVAKDVRTPQHILVSC